VNAQPLQPYRVLFPIGLTHGLLGAGLWPLYAFAVVPYPGLAHRVLMIQGFEQSFVLGFLLTAMPGFTKGEPCRPIELWIASLLAVSIGIAAVLGATVAAELVFVASVLLLLVVIGRRLAPSKQQRPPELMFVGLGLLLGLTGALLQLADQGAQVLGGRLLSLGMVLSLVLGLGGLLVPTFTGMRDPLVIPHIAAAHEERRKVVFYAAAIAMLAAAFAAEVVELPRVGAWLRAITATAMILLVWKLARLPRRRDAPAFAMWGSGWLVLAGLWVAALAPAFTLGALHMVFIGGFAMLTLGISTRVLVSHGRHPLSDEREVLSPIVVAIVLAALLARLGAEWWPSRATPFLAASGALWIVGWLGWASGALPRIFRMSRSNLVIHLPDS
jgi:uncharacterized protein involved in response to NO